MSANFLSQYDRRKLLYVAGASLTLFSLIAFFMFQRTYFGGWRCEGGEWISTGNPLNTQPTRVCPTPTPVRTKEEMLQVFAINVYFGKKNSDCTEVFPVERRIMYVVDSQMALLEAMDELTKGPTAEETALGYFSEFANEEEIAPEQISIKDDIVTVDLNQVLREGNLSFCRTSRKTKQLTETIKNLPAVKDIRIVD